MKESTRLKVLKHIEDGKKKSESLKKAWRKRRKNVVPLK